LAEILAMAGNSRLPGGVEETASPRLLLIRKRAADWPPRVNSPLLQIIHENGGQAEIAQEIVRPAPAAISYQYE
jgi:hypothetical protein